jgi:hypothetical protein
VTGEPLIDRSGAVPSQWRVLPLAVVRLGRRAAVLDAGWDVDVGTGAHPLTNRHGVTVEHPDVVVGVVVRVDGELVAGLHPQQPAVGVHRLTA